MVASLRANEQLSPIGDRKPFSTHKAYYLRVLNTNDMAFEVFDYTVGL